MASTESFEGLLSSRLLDVPDYQRGYAWETTQLEEFWEDLELIGDQGRHYTGTVVLRELGASVLDEDREVRLDLVLTNDNGHYANHCFARKRDGVEVKGVRTACYSTSALKQEQELATLAEWTPAEAVARQARLTDWALTRWKIDPAASGSPPLAHDEVASDLVEDAAEDTDPMLSGDVNVDVNGVGAGAGVGVGDAEPGNG